MQPIHELINRIRWDAEFGAAEFSIGYYDRVEKRIIVVPLGRASYDHPDAESLRFEDDEGRTVNIPFHRVRQVFRDGELIWNRDA